MDEVVFREIASGRNGSRLRSVKLSDAWNRSVIADVVNSMLICAAVFLSLWGRCGLMGRCPMLTRCVSSSAALSYKGRHGREALSR